LLELATGIVLPGTGESWEMLRLGDFSKQKTALSKLSSEMSEMIEWLLTTESRDRPTIKDIISHPTITNIFQQQQEQQTGSLQSYVYELSQPKHQNVFSAQKEESLDLVV
jgi:serine/threonine protein kinase